MDKSIITLTIIRYMIQILTQVLINQYRVDRWLIINAHFRGAADISQKTKDPILGVMDT